MSAHVTKRKHRISKMRTQRTLKIAQNSFTQSRVNTQRQLKAQLSPTRELKAEVTQWHPRDVTAVCAVQTRLSTESRDVIMLFCLSFTRSTRFLQADQFVTRLRRDEHATCCRVIPNCMRLPTADVFMNVKESEAVFWWVAIFRKRIHFTHTVVNPSVCLKWLLCHTRGFLRAERKENQK